jgi:hypothetical protein
MSSLSLRHPEDGLLLRYLDGELPHRKTRHLRKHLEACWQCRVDVEQLETTVGDCVRYRKAVLSACLPPPPNPWGDLAAEMERIEAALAGESVLAKLARALSPRRNPRLQWALSAAAVLLIGIAVMQQLRQTPAVEAAALLKKAIAASDARPRTGKRVRITTRTRQVTRVIGAAQPAAGETEIAQLFQAAHYDWNDPLSAKSYAAWHDGLSRRQDQVSTIQDRQAPDQSFYRINTTTSDGELVAATLKLRMTDFEAVEGRFEFRNRDWVEMTELVDRQTLPASTIAGTTGGMPRQPGMPPAPIEKATPVGQTQDGADSGFSGELRVVAALHQVGADLGDPVEIAREGRRVVVSGTGIPPQRQKEIHGLLDALPNVVVRFRDPAFPASAPLVQSEPAPRDAAGPTQSKYQARIEERLGGRPQFERFSGQLLDWTDGAMARAYALRRLAQQFAPATERRMNVADRRTLRHMGRDHLAAFAQDSRQIALALTPLLSALGGTAGQPEARPEPLAWQVAAEQLMASSRRVENLLAVMLGIAPADSALDSLPSQLLSALAQLRNSTEHCQRLLSYDDP